MSLLALAATLLSGGVVGLVSGLVGVGGGIVMVPLLYLLLAHPAWSGIGVPLALQAVVAHATSLFVIVPTALAGIHAYHRAGLVAWRVALPMAATATLAALAGVQVAIRLPPEVLKATFGLFLMASGLNLLRASRWEGKAVQNPRTSAAVAVLGGLLIGFVTSLLGVGGGIVAIPILIYLVRLEMRKVAATSLGVVVFSGLTAALTYGVTGWHHPDLPPGSLGYIFLPAGLALLPGAISTARLGARLNQRMKDRALKLLFGAVFLLVGLRLFLENLSGSAG
jgi:hypothetical protein